MQHGDSPTIHEAYESRPWIKNYLVDGTSQLKLDQSSILGYFRASLDHSPEAPCLIYFDSVFTYRQVDDMSNALAAALADWQVDRGDRVALMMQNIPQFVVSQLAVWKLGAIYVPLSPMLKQAEVTYHLQDSGAEVLIIEETLYRDQVESIRGMTPLRFVATTSDLDMLDDVDDLPARLANTVRQRAEHTADLTELIGRYESRIPAFIEPEGSDVAVLSYTSGTTGRPKGAMNTHMNIAYNAEVWRVWAQIDRSDVVAAIAPLFHITGPPGICGVAFTRGCPIVLTQRFDAKVVLAALERHRCTFALASITAFLALMNSADIARCDLSSFQKVFSGGAPVPTAAVERWQQAAGSYIHNCYGLTETTSPTIMVPYGAQSPVDPNSGALSIGVPTPGTTVRVVDPDTKQDLPPGEPGEFWIRGPGVIPGYWHPPESSAEAMEVEYFRTGDIGLMDSNGWFYAIDRSKDVVIASGFKVWPREVEDVLYQHAAVREAAVIGIPDSYRGETVKAFISLRQGESASESDIMEFCRRQMASYKYPRQVEIIDDLPKTPAGKILRRRLRDHDRDQLSSNGSGGA